MDRLGFAYTEEDDAASRARIRSDLEKIAAGCATADPALCALVLTGGFSRGEGTVREGAPVNDYDLVAIRRRPGGGARYHRIAASLSEQVGLEVDVLPVWRRRLPRIGRKLFWLDLRLGGRVIHGEADALRALPAFGPRDLAPNESARLLGNRAAGLILALPAPGEPADARQLALQCAKAAIAAMDATLLHEGLYDASLRARLGLAKGMPDAPTYAAAVDWKLAARDAPAVAWPDARAALLRAVEATGAERHADGWTERAFHLLRAKRLRPNPSHEVRRRAWDLLRGVQTLSLDPRVKASFFAQRALTLQ
ncbi:MAG: hypothetical protein QOE90_2716 [Thermoplasmata archaeon]|nr:hypothetical protein [Thermoplasmata archaeon]